MRTHSCAPAFLAYQGPFFMSYLNDPKHWLDRAEETRAKAEQFRYNEEARQRMLRIAREYDQLATHAAERARSNKQLEADGILSRTGGAPDKSFPA